MMSVRSIELTGNFCGRATSSTRLSDTGKMERYQAEALAFQHVPVDALLGFACYSDTVKAVLERTVNAAGLEMNVVVKRDWLFG